MLNILRYRIVCQISSHIKVFHRRYMKISPKMEMLFKRSDNIPRNYDLIYRETGYRAASLMYHTVNCITCVSLGAVVYSWYIGEDFNPDPEDRIRFMESPYQAGLMCIGVIATLTIAAVTRSRYALRIYYNEAKKTFRVIFIGKIPFTNEWYEFPQETATYIAKDSRLPWKSSLFDCNGRKVFLYDDKFKTQSHFYAMLKLSEL